MEPDSRTIDQEDKLSEPELFSTVHRRFPDLKLAIDPDELIYNHNGVVRFIASIPMIF